MSAMASQITGVSIVCSTACSGGDKKTSKLRVTGLIEGNPPVTGGFFSRTASYKRMFPFDDLIMWWPELRCLFSNCPSGYVAAYEQKMEGFTILYYIQIVFY